MTIEQVLNNLPTIETERLILRKVAEKDLKDIFDYASDIQVAKYATWNANKSMEDSKKVVEHYLKSYESHSSLVWGIVHKEDNKLIGTGGFITYDLFYKRAEIGYTLNRSYWHKGLATELATKLIEYGFNVLDFHRIEGLCHIDNLASVRVMEKAGMQFEGNLRDYLRKNDNFFDVKIFSIINNR